MLIFFTLSQRYIYPIDPTRLNEFGFSKELEEEQAKKKKEQGGGASEAIGGGVTNSQEPIEDKKDK